MMTKLRLWLASILIGDSACIFNVTVYQTFCLDVTDNVTLSNVNVNLGHSVPIVSNTGFYFANYKAALKNDV